MHREGIGKIRRTELLARLTALDEQVEAQEARVRRIREHGWNAKSAEERLKLLQESRRLYHSALVHLLGDDVPGGGEA